jgi:hypothetical protein
MTNANVANVNVVSMGKDRILTVQYKGGEKKVLVLESAIIVSYTLPIAASSSPAPGLREFAAPA